MEDVLAARVGELLEAARELLGEEPTLRLPTQYVLTAPCTSCRTTTMAVGAPAHRFVRDRRCTGCGGPWAVAPEGAPTTAGRRSVDAHDSLAGLRAEDVGIAPGDVVVAGSSTEEVAIRLARRAGEPFTTVPRPT